MDQWLPEWLMTPSHGPSDCLPTLGSESTSHRAIRQSQIILGFPQRLRMSPVGLILSKTVLTNELSKFQLFSTSRNKNYRRTLHRSLSTSSQLTFLEFALSLAFYPRLDFHVYLSQTFLLQNFRRISCFLDLCPMFSISLLKKPAVKGMTWRRIEGVEV
jgi:hypothetical protein